MKVSAKNIIDANPVKKQGWKTGIILFITADVQAIEKNIEEPNAAPNTKP